MGVNREGFFITTWYNVQTETNLTKCFTKFSKAPKSNWSALNSKEMCVEILFLPERLLWELMSF